MKKLTTQVDKHIFFDESGTGGDNIHLGLGILVCANPAKIHEKLDTIRKKYRYFNEIKFEKISEKRFKAVIVNKKQLIAAINNFPGQKVEVYEYKLKSGQPSKTESDRKS